VRIALVCIALSVAPGAQAYQSTSQGGTPAVQVGQRQTREATSHEAGVEPLSRINSRIENRVRSRIRNRVDRDYDPQANNASSIKAANDRVRRGNRTIQR
jgi:hypothetical protein